MLCVSPETALCPLDKQGCGQPGLGDMFSDGPEVVRMLGQISGGSPGGEDVVEGGECDRACGPDVELRGFGFDFGECVGAEQRRVDS